MCKSQSAVVSFASFWNISSSLNDIKKKVIFENYCKLQYNTAICLARSQRGAHRFVSLLWPVNSQEKYAWFVSINCTLDITFFSSFADLSEYANASVEQVCKPWSAQRLHKCGLSWTISHCNRVSAWTESDRCFTYSLSAARTYSARRSISISAILALCLNFCYLVGCFRYRWWYIRGSSFAMNINRVWIHDWHLFSESHYSHVAWMYALKYSVHAREKLRRCTHVEWVRALSNEVIHVCSLLMTCLEFCLNLYVSTNRSIFMLCIHAYIHVPY